MVMDAVQNPTSPVPYSAFTTTRRIDNQLLSPSPGNRFPAYLFYDPSANDLLDPIDPGPNQDTTANGGNIRWRQAGDTAANFVFPDGHAQTIGIDQLQHRQIRADPYFAP